MIYKLGAQGQLKFSDVWINSKLTFLVDFLLVNLLEGFFYLEKGFSSMIISDLLYSF